jgi:hypothetical protein
MKFCFDIDGTICSNTFGAYELALPFYERIEHINRLISQGHEVIFLTARGSETGLDWSLLTKNQLIDWGIKNPQVFFGKPSADVYIDDRGISDTAFNWES